MGQLLCKGQHKESQDISITLITTNKLACFFKKRGAKRTGRSKQDSLQAVTRSKTRKGKNNQAPDPALGSKKEKGNILSSQ
ncbi:hypothetical protein Y1Q_0015627 [Alligator mississippiensis]|uniref:Uncharacterized protein n=1 Tax=Alligator mississippiensis TaxID=8496 RepID=A0A151NPH8_ALLMI|nr:hypothetical protein Y1Q_0015627 [Alligator mississippiensis]